MEGGGGGVITSVVIGGKPSQQLRVSIHSLVGQKKM